MTTKSLLGDSISMDTDTSRPVGNIIQRNFLIHSSSDKWERADSSVSTASITASPRGGNDGTDASFALSDQRSEATSADLGGELKENEHHHHHQQQQQQSPNNSTGGKADMRRVTSADGERQQQEEKSECRYPLLFKPYCLPRVLPPAVGSGVLLVQAVSGQQRRGLPQSQIQLFTSAQVHEDQPDRQASRGARRCFYHLSDSKAHRPEALALPLRGQKYSIVFIFFSFFFFLHFFFFFFLFALLFFLSFFLTFFLSSSSLLLYLSFLVVFFL